MKLGKIYVHTATADIIRGNKFFIFDSPNPVEYLSMKKVLKSQIKRWQEPTFHPGGNKKS